MITDKNLTLFVLNDKVRLSFVLVGQRLDWSSMSVLKCASSPRLNQFATYVKEIIKRSTKNTVTELRVNRVYQLILPVITTY